MNRRAVLGAGAALPFAPRAGPAQTAPAWPSRQLRMVIPWPPGQSTDHQGRMIAQWLSERLGQTVVPENRPGAGGQIGTNAVAKAPPDGHALLAASIGPISFQPLVSRTPARPAAALEILPALSTVPSVPVTTSAPPVTIVAGAVAIALVVCGNWMISEMIAFTHVAFDMIPKLLGSG